jgi:hypothetical protein
VNLEETALSKIILAQENKCCHSHRHRKSKHGNGRSGRMNGGFQRLEWRGEEDMTAHGWIISL